MGETRNKDGEVVGYYHEKPKHQADVADSYMTIVTNPGYPRTLEELLVFGRDFFGVCIAKAEEKNRRYASPMDPFKNFRLAGRYGQAVRMSDKVSRLLNLTEPNSNVTGTPDESITDTCIDVANYAMLMEALRSNEDKYGR